MTRTNTVSIRPDTLATQNTSCSSYPQILPADTPSKHVFILVPASGKLQVCSLQAGRMPPYWHTRVSLLLLFDLYDTQVSGASLQLRCLRGDCLFRLLQVTLVGPLRSQHTRLVALGILLCSRSLDAMQRRLRCNCPANIGVFASTIVVLPPGSAPTPSLLPDSASRCTSCSLPVCCRDWKLAALETRV